LLCFASKSEDAKRGMLCFGLQSYDGQRALLCFASKSEDAKRGMLFFALRRLGGSVLCFAEAASKHSPSASGVEVAI
jgi:hypothetical protein